jgi:hypothetical protein
MMNRIRLDMGDSTDKGSDAEHHVGAIVLIDEEEYIEITIRLANTILELAKAGLHAKECEARVDEAIAEAIKAIEQAGIKINTDRMLDKWPPFPFSPN